uniref:Uncharacterized protein n=1 Tax=Sphaerodactylus townsendi TaxID=933632 RepID=A0ACB8FI08_9SAUR
MFASSFQCKSPRRSASQLYFYQFVRINSSLLPHHQQLLVGLSLIQKHGIQPRIFVWKSLRAASKLHILHDGLKLSPAFFLVRASVPLTWEPHT